MKYLRIISKSIILFAVFTLLNIRGASAQVIGDLGATSSGNWTAPATWSQWNGSAWVMPGASGTPTSLKNVFILAGSTVDITSSPLPCLNLTVEAGGKLWAGNGTNLYISVFGSTFICDGQVGNGAIFDQISFNIESATCTISGTGLFDASRMRKSANSNPTTNLIIARDINLRWNSASASAQLYNNASLTTFNVTINAGSTVNLIQSGPSTGNVCIDGNNGADAIEGGGTFTVNGTLIVSGVLYLSTNNTNLTYPSKWIINGLLRAYEIDASPSGVATTSLTVNNLGKLEINGTPAFSALSITNNTYIFNDGSTVEYSAAGLQAVRVRSEFGGGALNSYSNLILSNSGLKSTALSNLIMRRDITITGTAILDPNPNNSTISVGGNWTDYNSVGFSEKQTTVTFTNGGTQIITCPPTESYYVLRYQNTTGHLQFNTNVNVVFQLSFTGNGYVDLNSHTLTILNTVPNGALGGINGQNSLRYIYSEKTDNSSKITWRINNGFGTYIFPFGIPNTPTPDYIPVVVTKNTGALNTGDLTFSTYGTPPTNLPLPITPLPVTNLQAYLPGHPLNNDHWTVDRFWEVGLNPPAATTLDSVRFTYRITELPDSELSPLNMGAQFWDNTYWLPTQYGVPKAYEVAVDNFFVFNTSWTLTSLTSPLPIKLLYFDANPEEDKVILNWSTASEINNDYFTVEKSIDGSNFFGIGNIKGAGNSTMTSKYSLDDFKPAMGISYYRLKQTDFNGAFTYSNVVPVNYKNESRIFSIFPNPAVDKAYLLTNAGEYQEIFVRNLEGKTFLHYLVENSRQINPIQLTGLASGLYIIEVKSESDTQFLKLIKN